MTVDDAAAVAEMAVALADDDAEAVVTVHRQALLRFANGEPIQHSVMTVPKLRIRLRTEQRCGEADGEQFDEAAVRDTLAKARRQMGRLPAENGLLPSVGPQPQLAVTAWDDGSTLEAFGPAQRAEAAEAMAAPARAAGLAPAGISGTSELLIAMATSNGMRGRYRRTGVELSVTVQSGEASGSSRAASYAAAVLDPARMGAEAADIARRSGSPEPLQPGTWRVVLAPRAVASLIRQFFASGFNARAVLEGRSFLDLPLGRPLVGEKFTLRQDITHPLHQSLPFDLDGVGLRRVTLVERGESRQLLQDRRTAAELGTEPTGFSFSGGRLRGGASATALVMEGGAASEAELIEACGDGLYVSRLWYCNWVDPKACQVTGMTRDGLFRIRDGRLAEPLTNGRFNQNLLELFRQVLALGQPVLADDCVVPPVLADGFRLSSASSF